MPHEWIPESWAPVPGRPGWYAPPEHVSKFADREEDTGPTAKVTAKKEPKLGKLPIEEGKPKPKREWPKPELPDYLAEEAYRRSEEERFRRGLQEWELARRGYYYDPWLGKMVQGEPIYQELPTPPYWLEPNAEWSQWYKQVTTPKLGQHYTYYGQAYGEVPPVTIPEDYGMKDDFEKIAWLNYNAYETVYTDMHGNVIDAGEAYRRAQVNPDEPIRQVWFMGSGQVREQEFSAGDIDQIEALKAPAEALTERGEVVGGEWYKEPRQQEKARIDLVLKSPVINEILTTDWSYEDKLQSVLDFYSSTTKYALTGQGYYDVKNAILASLTPEQLEEARQRVERDEERRMERPKTPLPAREPVDEAALRAALEPLGITVLDEYPFISPLTEAHLMRLPTDVLDVMERYLGERGLSWSDYIAMSSGLYGGGQRQRGFRYAIPQQWS